MTAGDAEGENLYQGGTIESVSDILDIVSRPDIYLDDIIDVDHPEAMMGRNQHGAPRPFPFGLWFRGQSNDSWRAHPSVFRQFHIGPKTGRKMPQFYDEREMFTDLRLRATNIDLRGFNNLELMCLMQHHQLPTRLMDWTESPLVAAFFATSSQYYGRSPFHVENKPENMMEVGHDSALYVINAYRLNGRTNLGQHHNSALFHPQDVDVVLRSVMAEHTYIESVISKIRSLNHVAADRIAEIVRESLEVLDITLKSDDPAVWRYLLGGGLVVPRLAKDGRSRDPGQLRAFLQRMSAPVAVIPRRDHPRMDAQLSCFTMHGGKLLYDDVIGPPENGSRRSDWHVIPRPIQLADINGDTPRARMLNANGGGEPPKFMKKFRISKYAVSRIMIELDRLGVNESMIYPDIENQSKYVGRRWQTIGSDKPIWSLPRLEGSIEPGLSAGAKRRSSAGPLNYMSRLFGQKPSSGTS